MLDFYDLRSPAEVRRLSRACHAAVTKKVDDSSALPLLRAAHQLGLDTPTLITPTSTLELHPPAHEGTRERNETY